jgi:hypothetical protein
VGKTESIFSKAWNETRGSTFSALIQYSAKILRAVGQEKEIKE